MSLAISPTRASWAVAAIRWVFGIYFVSVGLLHFEVPEGLPALLAWMYELSEPLHAVAGTAEILGGLGLILPSLVGVAPRLASAAALGLSLVMLGAAAWHGSRGEWVQILGNLIVAAIMAAVSIKEWQRQRKF